MNRVPLRRRVIRRREVHTASSAAPSASGASCSWWSRPPRHSASSAVPSRWATERYLGAAGLHVVQALFVTSLFACILSFHNIVARYVFTLSNRKVFPEQLGEAHPDHRSPQLASGLDTVIVAVFIVAGLILGLDPVTQFYTWLAGISTVGIVILLIATSAAVLAFFARRARAGELELSVWRVFVAPGVGLLGLVAVFWLILQNLPSLVGNSTLVAIGAVALLVVVFALGAVSAARRPQVTLDVT
ncbi:MAG: hypothetical protein QOH82_72 [Mycobacterium sp.]|nr:hypothetical protein [Mycobacterium sp.]